MPVNKPKKSNDKDVLVGEFINSVKHNSYQYLKDIEKHLPTITAIGYIAGAIIVIIRRHLMGLPFSTSEIAQALIVGSYFLVIVGFLLYSDYVITFVKNHSNQKLFIICKLVCLVFIVIGAAALAYIFGDLITAAIWCGVGVIVMAIYVQRKAPTELRVVFLVLFDIFTIFLIPLDMGGLRGQPVYFCENSTQEDCKEYEYYGVADGLYRLKNEDSVYLIPIDHGYIRLR